ncbi:Tetratricopeptide repeat protein [Planctomycetes bacterium Pla163]|uniref:Tetratricopeptide repeat protein n=1 Tax=Rohdeia mirabilis TaxID=2528008 RepID=A0A518D4A9_9BACT|nr:Tetratricopeptide repeat protein [Planctomycetes bacterium Pla163]
MRTLAILLLVGLSASCSVFNHRPIPELGDPDVELDAVLTELRDARDKDAGEMDHEDPRWKQTRSRNEVLTALESLAFDFPGNARIRYTCGAAAYETGRRDHAQIHLDAALAANPRAIEATSLRARMSIEDGNYPRARRLVEDGLLLAPDAVELHMLGAQLEHLDGNQDAALAALNLAEKLGAESWRVDYHRALVHEELGSATEAENLLRRCLEAAPDFAPARSRLNRIEAR